MIKVRQNLRNFRKVVAIAICLAGSATMFAQDVITLKNGDDIKAIVQEIGTDEVKYKKFDNPNGPNYTLKKAEILIIRYENGSKDVFSEITTNTQSDKQQKTTDISTHTELSFTSGMWKKGGVLKNGAIIKPAEVRDIMSGNNKALETYNGGKALTTVGNVFSFVGGGLIGWDLGSRLGGGEGNGALLAAGGISIGVGLIMFLAGENKMKTSVQLYNSKASNTTSYQINFGFTQTGVGLCMRF